MTYVSISALAFPKGIEAEIEKRFAQRKKAVDAAPGFESFELLRPVDGEDRYFVITRWDSRENYEKWDATRNPYAHTEDTKRGMSVQVSGFELVQHDE